MPTTRTQDSLARLDAQMLDVCWSGSLWMSSALWATGIGVCLIQAVSRPPDGVWRYLLFGILASAVIASVWSFRTIHGGRSAGVVAVELTAVAMGFAFGMSAFVFAVGVLPFMTLRVGPFRESSDGFRLRPAFARGLSTAGGMVLVAGLGTMIWDTIYEQEIFTWARSYGAAVPRVATGNLYWWLVASFIVVGLGYLSLVFIMTLWWDRVVKTVKMVDPVDEERRQRLNVTLSSFLHDGVLGALEQIAAGHSVSATDRLRFIRLTQTIRNGILGDSVPRTTNRFVDSLSSMCTERGVVPTINKSLDGDPPIEVLETFRVASSALLNNLAHAGVDQVTMGIVSSSSQLRVTIRDEGGGFDPQTVMWSPHTIEVVFGSLAALDPVAKAEPHSAPGQGTTWSLAWPAQDTS